MGGGTGVRICSEGQNSGTLKTKKINMFHAAPALANAGPDSDLCGEPLEVIGQNKKRDQRVGILT